MAKKVEGYIKLQIPAGKATPAPPVGPALGQHGVNIVEFQFQLLSLYMQTEVSVSLLRLHLLRY